MSQNYEKQKTDVRLSGVIAEDNETVDLKLENTNKSVKIDDGVLIRVKSNVFGTLLYKNSKTGEETLWTMCGETQTMTMADLRAMKANQVNFFVNQWVVILGVDESEDDSIQPADIYKSLGITKYYMNYLEPSDFRTLCALSEAEIEKKVSLLSSGAKENLIVALNEFIDKGVLDSAKKVKAFEKALNCELADLK